MTRNTTAIIAILAALMTATPASAQHCGGAVTEVTIGDETLYLETRGDGAASELYLYAESNDTPGLQQGGDVVGCTPPGCAVGRLLWTDRCGHAAPDVLLVGYDGTDT